MTMTGHHLILHYAYVDDILERREPYRADHLAGIRQAVSRGEVVMAGATGDPVSGAAIVFRDVGHEAVERFAAGDPYVLAGLVTSWRVEPWNVVVAAPGG